MSRYSLRFASVTGILVCSTSPSDMLRVIQLREDHPQEIYACLGVHPLDESDWAEFGRASHNLSET